jgi:hypothetical protein
MPKHHIEGLITQLHERFADSDTSPEQEAMLARMKSQLAEWEGPKPPEDFSETAEMLLQEVEEEHPKAAGLVREIINALNSIGV